MPLGELPLRGAARSKEGRSCFWGSSSFAGLLDRRKEEPVSGGAPAARGCSIEGRRSLFIGELPLRGAARFKEGRACFLGELPLREAARLNEGGACFWGSSRCSRLLDPRREELVSGGAPAARGCSISLKKEGACFCGGSCLLSSDGCTSSHKNLYLGAG